LIVVSDHGAKRMKGCFCVNQWLEKIGYLKFKEKPKNGDRIQKANINWKKTKAWGWGGYYSRIFFNVKGREEQGIIKEKNLKKEIEKLKRKIQDFKGPDGEKWNNKVYTPYELYEEPKGILSDLMVYWDDLYWRAAGTVGHETMFLRENDTGPDDGVHDWYGLFMAYNKKEKLNFGNNLEIKDVFDIIIEVQDKSVATSGGYENYFEFKGKKYSHIFNPKTGYPVETDKIQVTVISQSPLFADIFATVFMILDEEKIDEISQEFNLGYLIIYKNRKIQKNKFFPEIKPI